MISAANPATVRTMSTGRAGRRARKVSAGQSFSAQMTANPGSGFTAIGNPTDDRTGRSLPLAAYAKLLRSSIPDLAANSRIASALPERQSVRPSGYPVRAPSSVAIRVQRVCSMPSAAATGSRANRGPEETRTTVCPAAR